MLLLCVSIQSIHAGETYVRDLASGGSVTESQFILSLEKADVVILGEVHDDPETHRVQVEIISRILDSGFRPALCFEMLTYQEEAAYLALIEGSVQSRDGRQSLGSDSLRDALKWERRGWPIWDAYAPMFMLASQYGLVVRHGDLPPELMRNLVRYGLLALPKLLRDKMFGSMTEVEFSLLSDRLQYAFSDTHSKGIKMSELGGLILAQMARDAHMAYRVSSVRMPVILIAGLEHARKDRGVPFHLKLRAPELRVVSVALTGSVQNGDVLPFDFLWMGSQ